ncbi:MAG: hypothetical protein ABSB95_14555 [Dissulfurispiraceae bacterium]
MHTLFTQEMLRRGFLASKAFYATYAHKSRHVNAYAAAIDEVFSLIAEGVKAGRIGALLKSPMAHAGFKRLA